MSRFLLILVMFVLAGCTSNSENLDKWLPMVPGHAHNDYLHDHPLVDALHYGFRSVEADIHLRDGGRLMVAHTRFGIRKNRTLQSLYLDPIKRLVTEHPDSVKRHFGQIILCIEIKTEFEPTYNRMKEVLEDYKDILTSYNGDTVNEKLVRVILIANPNMNIVSKEHRRLFTTDGWAADMAKYPDPHLMGMICLHPGEHFLEQIKQAHKNGQLVRAWGDFDNETEWKVMYDAGVDLIHTDRLEDFNHFIRSQEQMHEHGQQPNRP